VSGKRDFIGKREGLPVSEMELGGEGESPQEKQNGTDQKTPTAKERHLVWLEGKGGIGGFV